MSHTLLLVLAPAILVTSFISGVFGMAGGMMLMAIMLLVIPVGTAMVLHGVTQLTANAWRAWLWRSHIAWRVVVRYVLGLVAALAMMGTIAFVPDRGVVLIALGLSPFVALAVPQRLAPQVDRPYGVQRCGFMICFMNLLVVVSVPLLDIFFVRSQMNRHHVVATKASCQTLAHTAKLFYFGAL